MCGIAIGVYLIMCLELLFYLILPRGGIGGENDRISSSLGYTTLPWLYFVTLPHFVNKHRTFYMGMHRYYLTHPRCMAVGGPPSFTDIDVF